MWRKKFSPTNILVCLLAVLVIHHLLNSRVHSAPLRHRGTAPRSFYPADNLKHRDELANLTFGSRTRLPKLLHDKRLRLTTTCDDWSRSAISVDDETVVRSATVPPFLCERTRIPQCPIAETYLATIFHQILSAACLKKDHRGLFLDIGANAGFYSLYGATAGCEVVAFEMQPDVFASSLVMINNICDRITLVNHPVADSHYRVKIEGSAGSAHLGSSVDGESDGALTVTLPFILQFGRKSIVLTKIDTEGAEIIVLKSLLQALSIGRDFENIVLEFTPSWWSRFGISMSQGLDVLRQFAPFGYELYVIQWCQRARRETCAKMECTDDNIKTWESCEPPGNVSWADPDFEHVRSLGFGEALTEQTLNLARFDSDVHPPINYEDPTHTCELWLSKTKGPWRYTKGTQPIFQKNK